MTTKANIAIDQEYCQILIPLEVGKKLNLANFDWLKVNVLTDYVVLSLSKDEIDEELIDALIHEGVLICPE